jgi:3-methylfumaryl-CoA hydratase
LPAEAAKLQDWIGRQHEVEDLLDPRPARFMQATLGREPSLEVGDPLPPLWHWLYFLETDPASTLGRDGHSKRGGFLPPVALPRRMWAGGRFRFHEPLRLGETIRKISTIAAISEKTGRTGKLCFVTLRHEFSTGDTLALTEEHDIVYREDPHADAPKPEPKPAPLDALWSREVRPNPVLLFRYSALTFNGHRIHYDVDYAREVEGYPGLVFHGPLTATLMIDLALEKNPGSEPASYSYRALAPIAGAAPFFIEGRPTAGGADLWARRGDGALAMSGELVFKET